jgi:hypothetical protein
MVGEFLYRGEIFRATYHGVAGHEEIFILHIDKDGLEGGETSIYRMTEENDRSAPPEDVLVMLCDRLTPDIEVKDPNGAFEWRKGNVVFDVHDGLQSGSLIAGLPGSDRGWRWFSEMAAGALAHLGALFSSSSIAFVLGVTRRRAAGGTRARTRAPKTALVVLPATELCSTRAGLTASAPPAHDTGFSIWPPP